MMVDNQEKPQSQKEGKAENLVNADSVPSATPGTNNDSRADDQSSEEVSKLPETNNEAGLSWSRQAEETPDKRPGVIIGKDFLDRSQRETAILSENNSGLRRMLKHDPQSQDQTSTLGEQREVILVIRGMVERVVMMENIAYKLGRFELGTRRFDEVDLTPYGALDRGVSRVHAQIHLHQDHLYVTDLNSTNGTYLAGKRLPADTPTLLRKGDELLVGRLAIQVLFR